MPRITQHAPFTPGAILRVRLPAPAIRNQEDADAVGMPASDRHLPNAEIFIGWFLYPRQAMHWGQLEELVERAENDPDGLVR